MNTFKIAYFIPFLLLLMACNNQNNKAESADKVSTTEQQTKSIEPNIKTTLDLTRYGIANNPKNILGGLKVGDQAPDFTMLNQDGLEESLEATLQDGPVLLVFLRAEWCSFCVRHLQEFQDNIQDIHYAGEVKVIAVSPQERSYMKEFHQEHQFSFPILHDKDHSTMKNYKVFFHVSDKYNDYIEEAKGNRIEVFNGDPEPVMPIPATYLIGQDKIIKYVHYDPNYKKRSNVKEVIELI